MTSRALWFPLQTLWLQQLIRALLVGRIGDAEHDGDRAMKDMAGAPGTTFVTPLDREDLYHLTNEIESVSDLVSSTASYYTVHQGVMGPRFGSFLPHC